jgi:hypothetical protein
MGGSSERLSQRGSKAKSGRVEDGRGLRQRVPCPPAPRLTGLADSTRPRGQGTRPLPRNRRGDRRIPRLRRPPRRVHPPPLPGLRPRVPSRLYHAVHSAITAWLRQHTGQPEGQPGLVVAVQTFGDFLFWRHRGFSVDAGEAPPAADDASGRRRLAEYLLRAPFSLEKITSRFFPPPSSSPRCSIRFHPRACRRSAPMAGTATRVAGSANGPPGPPRASFTLHRPAHAAAGPPGGS